MAATLSTRAKFPVPAYGDTRWDVQLAAILARLDAIPAVGDLLVTAHEAPSASRTVDVAAGNFVAGGTLKSYAGGSLALAPGVLTYLWLDATATLQSGSAWPTGGTFLRLAAVTTDATTVTAIVDARWAFVAATF